MKNSQDKLRLLTLQDAAENLQISKRTLLRMIQKKEVPAFKVGGQWRIQESQFRKWVDNKENGDSGLSSLIIGERRSLKPLLVDGIEPSVKTIAEGSLAGNAGVRRQR